MNFTIFSYFCKGKEGQLTWADHMQVAAVVGRAVIPWGEPCVVDLGKCCFRALSIYVLVVDFGNERRNLDEGIRGQHLLEMARIWVVLILDLRSFFSDKERITGDYNSPARNSFPDFFLLLSFLLTLSVLFFRERRRERWVWLFSTAIKRLTRRAKSLRNQIEHEHLKWGKTILFDWKSKHFQVSRFFLACPVIPT